MIRGDPQTGQSGLMGSSFEGLAACNEATAPYIGRRARIVTAESPRALHALARESEEVPHNCTRQTKPAGGSGKQARVGSLPTPCH
jgi:hypothetical protein